MLEIDPTEVYFADGPQRGKFMVVNTWPVRTVKAHTFEASYLHQRNPDEFIEWEEIVYVNYITVTDTDGSRLRIAHIGPRPRIKDLLMRD